MKVNNVLGNILVLLIYPGVSNQLLVSSLEHRGPPSGANSARQSPIVQHRVLGPVPASSVSNDRYKLHFQTTNKHGNETIYLTSFLQRQQGNRTFQFFRFSSQNADLFPHIVKKNISMMFFLPDVYVYFLNNSLHLSSFGISLLISFHDVSDEANYKSFAVINLALIYHKIIFISSQQ